MPLAALFIGGVLPAQLDSLIRKRAGYMNFVAHWSWTLCATALGIILGETYQKPQAASSKLDNG